MWITTITYDLVALRALSNSDRLSLMSFLQHKKNELKAIDGAGESTPEYPAPDNPDNIFEDQTTLTIKRAWNQQANAQAFVDHFVGISQATAILEQPV